jgi:hypothetical protein
MSGIDLTPQFEEIIAADLSEIDKLSKAFAFLISEQVKIARREVELHRAVGDKDALIKEQIKANTMEYALSVFGHCYFKTTVRKYSDE